MPSLSLTGAVEGVGAPLIAPAGEVVREDIPQKGKKNTRRGK
jgi:hypothetical protein